MSQENLGDVLGIGAPRTLLSADHPDLVVAAALGERDGVLDDGDLAGLRSLAAAHPDSSLAWALLARAALEEAGQDPGDAVVGYAFARVGYHRGLDALRRAGWRGQGLVPATHPANRGFLAALVQLGRAAEVVGEQAEVVRIADFLTQCDPEAAAYLADGIPAAGYQGLVSPGGDGSSAVTDRRSEPSDEPSNQE